MTYADGGSLESKPGCARAYAAAVIAAKSLGIETWQAQVVANTVIDALEVPNEPRKLAVAAALEAVRDANFDAAASHWEVARVAAAAAVLELGRRLPEASSVRLRNGGCLP